MPEPRPTRRLAALAVMVVLGVTAGAPAVLAQTEGEPKPPAWDPSRSEFTDPFEGGSATVSRESFPISGVFTRTNAVEQAAVIDVSFGGSDDPTVDTTTPSDPTTEPAGVQCAPDDQRFSVEDSDASTDTARFAFTVPAEASVWPCNGRYSVSAVASIGPDRSEPISGVLTVAVPPKPVTVVDARVLDGERDVEISWEPLSDDELAADAAGYRVERAGPGDDGAFGEFTSVGTVGVHADPTLTDRPTDGGTYRYRVRALRNGADGPIPSPVEGTAVADAQVAGEAKATSTTTTTSTSRPRIGAVNRTPTRRSTTPSAGVPTTVDPGFENELDYGDREPGSELAGESGRSIIRSDDAGIGFAAPVAGALVLLGWAGHLAYLNRLARQF